MTTRAMTIFKTALAGMAASAWSKIVNRSVAFTAILLLGSTGTQAQQCAEPSGAGGCFTTIQTAVTAAAAGQTVTVNQGFYNEAVTVPAGKDGLLISGVGIKTTLLDSGSPGPGGAALTILSNNVAVTGITMQTGSPAVAIGDGGVTAVDGVVLSKVRVRSATGDCVRIDQASNVTVEGSTIESCDDNAVHGSNAPGLLLMKNTIRLTDNAAVECNPCSNGIVSGNKVSDVEDGPCFRFYNSTNVTISGNSCSAAQEGIYLGGACDGAVVTKNKITSVVDGIRVNGNTAVVTKNKLSSAGGDGVTVYGNTAVVTKNTLSSIGNRGIYVSGSDPVIDSNKVASVESEPIGVYCSASCNGSVSGNKTTGASDDDEGIAIYLAAAGTFLVADNKVVSGSDGGIEITADFPGATLRANKVLRSGFEGDPGIEVLGSGGVTIEDNFVSGGANDGFKISGSGHVLTNNTATENGQDGFDIQGTGIVMTGNVASDNVWEGIDASAASTVTLTGNTSTGNRPGYEFCDDSAGGVTDGGGNSFVVAGAPACQLD